MERDAEARKGKEIVAMDESSTRHERCKRELREVLIHYTGTEVRNALADLCDGLSPVASVRWVPIESVQSNQYNPNSVATEEMKLLYMSIKEDGYTQPIVTIWDDALQKYVIIDGFHRYTTMRVNKDIYDAHAGLLPIVVLKKDIKQRMASTVRHNRARGKHSTEGMSNMIYQMLEQGMSDEQICNQLGMEPEELLRLKHITGYAILFKDVDRYGQSFVTSKQVKIRKKWEKEQESEEKT